MSIEAMKQALAKVRAAQQCHPNAVMALLCEADELLEQAIATEESSNAAKAAATQRNDSEHLEPVAWGNLLDGFNDSHRVLITNKRDALEYSNSCYTLTPLYAHPPQRSEDTQQPKATQEPKREPCELREWVGLTDEEIMDVAFNFDVPSISLRTIEAKLKEKNT